VLLRARRIEKGAQPRVRPSPSICNLPLRAGITSSALRSLQQRLPKQGRWRPKRQQPNRFHGGFRLNSSFSGGFSRLFRATGESEGSAGDGGEEELAHALQSLD